MNDAIKFKRFDLTNAADGYPYNILRIDRQLDGLWVRTWSSNGQLLVVSADGSYLELPGTKTMFVLLHDED